MCTSHTHIHRPACGALLRPHLLTWLRAGRSFRGLLERQRAVKHAGGVCVCVCGGFSVSGFRVWGLVLRVQRLVFRVVCVCVFVSEPTHIHTPNHTQLRASDSQRPRTQAGRGTLSHSEPRTKILASKRCAPRATRPGVASACTRGGYQCDRSGVDKLAQGV